ncbi:MAG: adenine deaminase [Clostridia bacterium]|nr:adenine deaminase [Clostridia bacterium]
MRTLFRNGRIINVFTDTVQETNVLIDGERIIGVGAYSCEDADSVVDVSGKVICPGLIDGHIHIESTMLNPAEFVRACLPHGTTTVIADPHEIANVSGLYGIGYMIETSRKLPMTVYYVVPSCVPATEFDESGGVLNAQDIAVLFNDPYVIGLGEMMNFPGVISGVPDVMAKIGAAHKAGKLINGHAPMISGAELDRYIAAGIFDDHECSTIEEALERLNKGQWIMIRQGTAARDLEALLPLFEEPLSRRCLLVTDDKHPADLLHNGHIDSIIRQAVQKGAPVLTAVRMATLQAAQRFGLNDLGAIAPGYQADLLILDDLETMRVKDVYRRGVKVVTDGQTLPFADPQIRPDIWKTVRNSVMLRKLDSAMFHIEPGRGPCRVIRVIPDQLITKEYRTELDLTENNGVDTEKDIIKLAVIERHVDSGHIGLGYITGLGIRKGAIASSVSHDSHNLIVAGVTDEDMTVAANHIREIGGGLAVVCDGRVLADMPLPIAGLMGLGTASEMAEQNRKVREAAAGLGSAPGIEPFMNLAFVSLPVIPDIKMTTQGLVDVNAWKRVPLFADNADKA